MGCDIHIGIDYDMPRNRGKVRTRCFAKSVNAINRNYLLFGLLTNGRVRMADAEGHAPNPRGYPKRMSYELQDKFFLGVGSDDSDKYEAWENWCKRSSAGRYARSYGSSFFKGDPNGAIHVYDPEIDGPLDEYGCPKGSQWRIEHPDLHTPSWLTASELSTIQSVLARTKFWPDLEPAPMPELDAVIGAMEALENYGYTPRLVFTFDN